MSQCEKTENQAEQNESHAVGRVETYPTSPHGCFAGDDGRNLGHADLQRRVAGREHGSPQRINEMEDSEGQYNARTENHENFCGQDALLILALPCLICVVAPVWQRVETSRILKQTAAEIRRPDSQPSARHRRLYLTGTSNGRRLLFQETGCWDFPESCAGFPEGCG